MTFSTPVDRSRPLDPAKLRGDFPILSQTANSGAPLVYLDNAASTQRPASVLSAMDDCYRRTYANVHRGIHTLSEAATDLYEQARRITTTFLNAEASEQVIFTAGTTAAINTVARSWGEANVVADDVILLTMMEHHANIVPWHQLAARTGCRVEFLPVGEEGFVEAGAVEAAFAKHDGKIKMFAFTAVSNVLGTINPVEQWAQIAHAHGAKVLVDAAQAAPHMPLDVQAWDPDFLVFSGHKVCGPTGIGVLYGRQADLDAMPPFLGGGAMISEVRTDGFVPAGLPEKFEAGTPPIVEAIGLAAAIDYLTGIGLERIHAHELALTKAAHERLAGHPWLRILGPRDPQHKGGIVSFEVENVHAHDVAQWMDTRGIAVRAGHHCAMPLHKACGISATARASFYLYNSLEDVNRFAEALEEVQQKFARTGRRRRRRRDASS